GVKLIEPPWARRLPHTLGEIIAEWRWVVHPRWTALCLRLIPTVLLGISDSARLRIFPSLPANRLFGILRYGFGVTMICPQCRSDNCFRSHRDGIFDFVLTAAGLRPWRCHSCERRFHAWRVAAVLERFAHCPRCGNFDLEHISRERVEAGTLIFAKRWLRFPAYRCDPCRHRFFSVL